MEKKNNVLNLDGDEFKFGSWKVYHPNGKHMFTSGIKKAKWYLDRDLAVIIGENKIKLTFEPEGYGFADEEDFGRSIREIKCVVSGTNINLQKHHIVPYCYRTYFPKKYKSRNHHDVVLINNEKHSEYEIEATKYKNELAIRYNVKTIEEYNKIYTRLLKNINKTNSISISKIKAILNGYGKISQDKINDNLMVISKNTEIDYNFLKKCNYIQIYKLYKILNENSKYDIQSFQNKHKKYYDHGFHLVSKLNTDKKIEEFIKLWRKHFIKIMKPKYMPQGWSINFRCKNNI